MLNSLRTQLLSYVVSINCQQYSQCIRSYILNNISPKKFQQRQLKFQKRLWEAIINCNRKFWACITCGFWAMHMNTAACCQRQLWIMSNTNMCIYSIIRSGRLHVLSVKFLEVIRMVTPKATPIHSPDYTSLQRLTLFLFSSVTSHALSNADVWPNLKITFISEIPVDFSFFLSVLSKFFVEWSFKKGQI